MKSVSVSSKGLSIKINKPEINKNNKIALRKAFGNDPYEFLTRYFAVLNGYINTQLPEKAPIVISGHGKKSFIYIRPQGDGTTLSVENQIALFLNNKRELMLYEYRNNVENLDEEIYALRYLYHWNNKVMKSKLLEENLSELFTSLNDEIQFNSDIYTIKELRRKCAKLMKLPSSLSRKKTRSRKTKQKSQDDHIHKASLLRRITNYFRRTPIFKQ